VDAFRRGYNINCQLLGYSGVDYRKAVVVNKSSARYEGDPSFIGAYFDIDTPPYEVVFVKWNNGRYDLHKSERYCY